jgi:hypothetical protein
LVDFTGLRFAFQVFDVISATKRIACENLGSGNDGCDNIEFGGHGMTEDSLTTTGSIPPEISAEMRRLMHDLSNALEIVLQAGYLLSTTETDGPVKEWIGLLDGGAQQALEIHRQLREYVRTHS